nr:MAG TPA: hypothetical protein [Caudoviricetes sp.]
MRFSFHDSRLHQCPLITLYSGSGKVVPVYVPLAFGIIWQLLYQAT